MEGAIRDKCTENDELSAEIDALKTQVGVLTQNLEFAEQRKSTAQVDRVLNVENQTLADANQQLSDMLDNALDHREQDKHDFCTRIKTLESSVATLTQNLNDQLKRNADLQRNTGQQARRISACEVDRGMRKQLEEEIAWLIRHVKERMDPDVHKDLIEDVEREKFELALAHDQEMRTTSRTSTSSVI